MVNTIFNRLIDLTPDERPWACLRAAQKRVEGLAEYSAIGSRWMERLFASLWAFIWTSLYVSPMCANTGAVGQTAWILMVFAVIGARAAILNMQASIASFKGIYQLLGSCPIRTHRGMPLTCQAPGRCFPSGGMAVPWCGIPTRLLPHMLG